MLNLSIKDSLSSDSEENDLVFSMSTVIPNKKRLFMTPHIQKQTR